MNAETVKTIAAFSGLILGLFNLGLSLYRDFLRKGKLQLSVESAVAKHDGEGSYMLQVSLMLTASGGEVFIKDIFLCNDEVREFGWKSPIPVLKLAPFIREDLLVMDSYTFFEKGKEMLANAREVRGLKIADKEYLSTTLVEEWETPRKGDRWHKLPLTSWSVRADYRNKTVEVPFSFTVHTSSLHE